MSLYVCDCECDGPYPGDYSMVSFGAVLVDETLDKTFYGKLYPISDRWNPDALAVSGHSREEVLTFDDPIDVMKRFAKWIDETNKNGRPILISDNNQFDGMFICYYFHKFYGSSPFGFSSRRIGDLYAGLTRDFRAKWKHLRKTRHSHNPVDDAMGNAEALLEISKKIKGIL